MRPHPLDATIRRILTEPALPTGAGTATMVTRMQEDTWGPRINAPDFNLYIIMYVAIILLCAALLSLSALLVVRFCICSRACANRRSSSTTAQPRAETEEELQKRKQQEGEKLAKAMPTVVFHRKEEGQKELAGDAEETECSICLAQFEEGETVRVVPACRHGFHGPCIEQWLQNGLSCPTCRGSCRRDESPVPESATEPETAPLPAPEGEPPSAAPQEGPEPSPVPAPEITENAPEPSPTLSAAAQSVPAPVPAALVVNVLEHLPPVHVTTTPVPVPMHAPAAVPLVSVPIRVGGEIEEV